MKEHVTTQTTRTREGWRVEFITIGDEPFVRNHVSYERFFQPGDFVSIATEKHHRIPRLIYWGGDDKLRRRETRGFLRRHEEYALRDRLSKRGIKNGYLQNLEAERERETVSLIETVRTMTGTRIEHHVPTNGFRILTGIYALDVEGWVRYVSLGFPDRTRRPIVIYQGRYSDEMDDATARWAAYQDTFSK